MSDSNNEPDVSTNDDSAAPATTHSVGEQPQEEPTKAKPAASKPPKSAAKKRSERNQPSYHGTLDDLSSDSSSSSASSPSEDEANTTEKTKQTSGSATSPSSDSSDEEPSTSTRAHSARRSPQSSQEVKRQPKRRSNEYSMVTGDTPPVSPNFTKPATRRDAELEAKTSAQSLHDLRAEVNDAYTQSFANWDRENYPGAPPVAFTREWFNHDLAQPYVKQYTELVPTVMARQAKALKAAAEAATSQPASGPAIKRNAQLEKKTKARTLVALRAQIEQSYRSHYSSFKEEYESAPPVAFTTAWFEHEFCTPFIRRYKELEPLVLERQAEDLRQAEAQRATDPPEPPMEVDQLAANTVQLAEEEDLELDEPMSDSRIDQLVNEVQVIIGQSSSGESIAPKANKDKPPTSAPTYKAAKIQPPGKQPPAATVVSSSKPTKPQKPPAKTTHPVDKPKNTKAERTHSVQAPATVDPRKKETQRKTVASIKRRQDTSDTRSNRSSTSSKRSHDPARTSREPPPKDARRRERTPSPPPTPCMKRHKERMAKTQRRNLVPIVDGCVSKDWAVYVAMHGHQQNPWPAAFMDPQKPYELLGLINHFGVPASYLRPQHCKHPPAGDHMPFAYQTYEQLELENTILPWDFILTSTFGALPPYWRKCTDDTRRHLTDALENSSKYRDFDAGGIGPTGFDLRSMRPNNTLEYEEQRQNLIRFAKIAHNTRKGLTVMIYFDDGITHTDSVHLDAIQTLKDEGIPSRQPIHLLFNKATALELVHWLEAFPRTLIGLDLEFLGDLRTTLGQPRPDPTDDDYLKAQAMRDLLQYVPLENIALHSGCPEPNRPMEMGVHKTPYDLLGVAGELQTLTGTKAEVIHANNARNLINYHRADHRLLDFSVPRRDYRDLQIGPRLSLENLADKIFDLFGGRPRAAPREQEEQEERRRRQQERDKKHEKAEEKRRQEKEWRQEQKKQAALLRKQLADITPDEAMGVDAPAPSRHHSTSQGDHRRGRSPARQDRHRRDRSSSSEGRYRGNSAARRRAQERQRRNDEWYDNQFRTYRRPRTPHSGEGQGHNSPQPTDFVVDLEPDSPKPELNSPMDFEGLNEPKPPTDSKPMPKPSAAPGRRQTDSRLAGRVSRGGQILPTTSTVRTKIQSLQILTKDKPQLSVRTQLNALRHQQQGAAAHSASSTSQTAQTTHSVERATVLNTPDKRLIKDPPMFNIDMFPDDPHLNDIYNETLKIVSDAPPGKDGLRPAKAALLASAPLVPAQPELFQVSDQPQAEDHPLHPLHECNGDDEDIVYFHLPVALAGLVTNRRWARQQGILGVKNMQALLARIRMLKVRSLAQLVLLKYINRLRANDEERTPNALQFLYEVLTAQDLRRKLPKLLRKYKPLITDDDTNDPWPTRKDLRHALDNWCCYCLHAAVYVMEHLSGPIIYQPNWLSEEDVPATVYQVLITDMVDDNTGLLSTLRHQMYRQYGHAYIEAIKLGLPEFNYERYDDDKKKKLPLGTPTTLPTVLFVDQYIWDTYVPDLQDDVQPILVQMTDRDGIIEQVIHYYPCPLTTRVVFWFGPDYLTNGNKGFCFILASLCYHYTTHFGNVEQYVVLPTYIPSQRKAWTYSVLTTYIQREAIMPYARVALGPHDVRLWERDEREFRKDGQLRKWDSEDLDEVGHYLTEKLIKATKVNLKLRHDLDLWISDETTSEATAPTTTTSTSDHRHKSSASSSRSSTAALDLQVPSTSDLRTHSVPEIDVRAIAASLAEKLPNKGATADEQALIASTVAFIHGHAFDKAADSAAQAAQPRLDNINRRLSQLQRSPKKSDHKKDSRDGSRKDQDRKPRK